MFETITHLLTGSLFWICTIALIISKLSLSIHRAYLVMCILESCLWASFLSILPDVDHFIAARSLKLADAQNLSGRPFLHWAGLHIIIFIFLIIFSLMRLNSMLNQIMALSWLVLIAFISHIFRDSMHRSLWLWPPPNKRTGMLDNDEITYSLNFVFVNFDVWPWIPINHIIIYLLAIGILLPTFSFCAIICEWDFRHFSPIIMYFCCKSENGIGESILT